MNQMHTPLNAAVKFKLQNGFSLVELMVAMVLGLILIAGVMQVLLSNKQLFDSNIGVARMQENARFVLAEVAKDLRMAGYRGCNSETLELTNKVKIGSVANDFLGFSTSLIGYEAEGNKWSDVAASTYATGTDVSTTADRIVIKNLDSNLLQLSTPADYNATSISVVSTSDIATGDILFIGDCEKGATVAVTGVSGNTISFANSSNLTKDLTADKSRFVTSDTLVHRLETKSYFIARSSAYTNNRGEQPWSLWRRVNDQTPAELVVGVEDLQILYGIDTTGDDGIPDSYVKADTTVDMEKVVVARIQVTANGIDETSNGPIKRAFSLTVRLRNRLAG